MNILEFTKKFPDEQSCVIYLKELREKQGIICDNKVDGIPCGCTKHWWLDRIQKFQCSKCNSRTNLTSGTMMEKSKIPLTKWFMCIHLMTTTKKPFSCLELQRQLGFKRYEPVWNMMRKVRIMMGKRDERYNLKGTVEMDDAFFEVVTIPERDELGNKIDRVKSLTRGRGSERQSKVLVTVESEPREQTKPYRKSREMGYVKMEVIESTTSENVNGVIENSVDEDSHIISDKFLGFKKVRKVVKKHTRMKVDSKDAMKKLPWVHTMISNCKRELLGVHHSIGKEYLQLYLNEFCYKVNRRNFVYRDSFDGLLVAGLDGNTLN